MTHRIIGRPEVLSQIRLAYSTGPINQVLDQDKWSPIGAPLIFDANNSTEGFNQEDLEESFGLQANSGSTPGITAKDNSNLVYLNATALIEINANTQWGQSIGFAIFDTTDFTQRPLAAGSFSHPRQWPITASITLGALPPLKPYDTFYLALDCYSGNEWTVTGFTVILQP